MATINILGKCIGSCVIDSYLILFTTDSSFDRIYKVFNPNSNESNVILLFRGHLKFNENNKIQTLPFYENKSIQKVYWIDGINQPRVINIARDDSTIHSYDDTSFDFIQKLQLNESVSITKKYDGGSFKSGVIQYAFTYFNKSGAESNIFYTTPLNHIALTDRAGKPDEIVNNIFKIEIDNVESKYEYLRIYSIYRTALNTTPEVKSLIDLKINSTGKLSFIDSGLYGSIVSSDILLYIGGEELVPGCMSQKNNTLFFGNIQLKSSNPIPSSLNKILPNADISFEWKISDPIRLETKIESEVGYPYKPNSLQSNTDGIKHFKFDETYRLGIQGQYENGKWSTPIWLGIDKKVDKRYVATKSTDSIFIKKIYGSLNINTDLCDKLIDDYEFIKVRPVIVPLEYSDRTIIAQGLVNNTLAIMSNRFSENIKSSKFAYPDYLFRTESKRGLTNEPLRPLSNGRYSHFDLLKLNNDKNPVNNQTPNYFIENMANWNTVDYKDIYNGIVDFNKDFLFVDKNMVNFWSPDITNNTGSISSYLNSVNKVGLYGFAFPTGLNTLFKIDSGSTIEEKTISRNIPNYDNTTIEGGWDYRKRNWTSVTSNNNTIDVSFPLWLPELYKDDDVEIQFTNATKSGHIYFGINGTLLDNERYELNINKPVLQFNDSDSYYNTNDLDGGDVLYSKKVEKNYPSGTFKNIVNNSTSIGYSAFIKYGMSMKYNTASHALFSFKKNNGYYSTMPRLENVVDSQVSYITPEIFETPYYWGESSEKYSCDIIDNSKLNNSIESYNSLPIFDLYSSVTNDPLNIDYNKYGGTSDDALYNNNWIPCGDTKKLQPNINLEFTDGDTYVQRFDLLRVFPDNLTQINQHTEIISFICESFINLDGRSDVNRYNTDSSLMTPTNYGLLNSVYSQKNNYFNYNILDPLLFNTTNFTNTIIWSKTKIAGSINDAWTNLNMLSSIDLDGVYGEVSSINLFNNDLYAFQPKGVARLLFNERVQQQASDGVSVELTNGYKVPEYRYLSNQYGASNKWSIIEGKQGIYFIDYINRSLMSIGDGIKDLGLSLGFKSWFNEKVVGRDFNLSYDRVNNDLYIHDDTYCLNYSETLGSFVSFFDYINVPQMKNVWDSFISIGYSEAEDKSDVNKSTVWLHNKGDYNMFYGIQKPFSVEYLVNPEPLSDKVFNTFEYRLNDQFIDWNNLELTNWYQYGELNDRQYLNSLKRKFNVNRVQLPRQSKTLDNNTGLVMLDTRNSLNRIRSTWSKLKLSHKTTAVNINKKFDMQDLTVTYTI